MASASLSLVLPEGMSLVAPDSTLAATSGPQREERKEEVPEKEQQQQKESEKGKEKEKEHDKGKEKENAKVPPKEVQGTGAKAPPPATSNPAQPIIAGAFLCSL